MTVVTPSTHDLGDDPSRSLPDVLSRRNLLIGGAVATTGSIGGGLWLFQQSDRENPLAAVEDRFFATATTINDTTLANPRQNGVVHREAAAAVNAIDDLQDDSLPDDSETEQRVTALRRAADYYRTLLSTLEVGQTLTNDIVTTERDVVTNPGDTASATLTSLDTNTFGDDISQFADLDTDAELLTPDGQPLIPNHESVIDGLYTQQTILANHLTAQQAYLETASTIEAGMRALEDAHFETARETLREARETLTAGIPELKTEYGLGSRRLSLQQYAELLDSRRQGVSRLLAIAQASTPAQHRRAISAALDRFFEARSIVTAVY